MPNAGDAYTITLKKTHLEWGTHRYTSSRGMIYGEGYLPIPANIAQRFNIYNSNNPSAVNVYSCSSSDGFLQNVQLKAGGATMAGDVYAKNLHGSGNLQVLGDWFHHVGAVIGDRVEVCWNSPTDIVITRI